MDNSEDIILYKDNNNITVSKPEHQNTWEAEALWTEDVLVCGVLVWCGGQK